MTFNPTGVFRHKRFADMPVRWKVIGPVIAFFLALLILLALLYFAIRSEVIEDAFRRLEYATARTSDQIADQLSHMASLSKLALLSEPDVRPILEQTAETGLDVEAERSITSLAFEILFVGNDVHSAFIYDRAGNGVFKFKRGTLVNPISPLETPWYGRAIDQQGTAVYTGTYGLTEFTRWLPDEQTAVFGVARGLVSFGPARVSGVLVVNSSVEYLSEVAGMFTLADGQRTILTDGAGNPVFDSHVPLEQHPVDVLDQAEEIRAQLDGESIPADLRVFASGGVLGATVRLPKSGWILATTIPQASVLGSVRFATFGFAIGAIVLLLLTILLLRAMSKRIVAPLTALSSSMQKLQSGDFEVQVQGSPAKDEIGSVTRTFDSMVRQLRELVEERYVKQIQLKELEIENLQRQINPHFLYNSLETVHMSAEAHDDGDTAQAVRTLSRFLRYSLNSSDRLVSLADEVTHLKEYLSFYERTTDVHVRVDIQLEPAAADAEMPSLILQPLVENALEHGLREAPKAARIAVSGYARNGSLFLTVRDNGSGMSPEMLQSVRNSLHGDVPPRAHVGIWNVNRRIRLLFGDQYGLYVESTPSHGTEVRVELQNR